MLAEGLPVKEGYVTEEERQGVFQAADLVYADSSDDEMSEFLDKTYDHALFMMKYEEIKSANMIYK